MTNACEYDPKSDPMVPRLDAAVMLLGCNTDEVRLSCWQDLLDIAARDGVTYGSYLPFARWIAMLRNLLLSDALAAAKASPTSEVKTAPYGSLGVEHRRLRSEATGKIESMWPHPSGCFSHQVSLIHRRAIGPLLQVVYAKSLDELRTEASSLAAKALVTT